MPSGAEEVHGLTDIFLSDKPRFEERCEDLLEFIADSPLVAHNASFDFGFLDDVLSQVMIFQVLVSSGIGHLLETLYQGIVCLAVASLGSLDKFR